MLNLDDDERLDQAIERFATIVERLHARQDRLEHRLATLYQGAAIAFTVVVASLSFLVIILSQQLPGMTSAIGQMNDRFANVAANMAHMDRSVARMKGNMERFPEIVANVDRIHFGVAELSNDVEAMGATMAAIDLDLGTMAANIGDLRQSFEVMEVNVGLMGRDVNHLSSPARVINQFNPFR